MRCFLVVVALWVIAGPKLAAAEPVNRVLGDASWIAKFGGPPGPTADERQRIATHLAYVVERLRGSDPGGDSSRARNLALLDRYIAQGVFPRNVEYRHRRSIFRDGAGRWCAVGFLIAASDQALARRIDAEHHGDSIYEMRTAGLAAWVAASGLTLDELAMIQPTYADDPPPASLDDRTLQRMLEQHARPLIVACLEQYAPALRKARTPVEVVVEVTAWRDGSFARISSTATVQTAVPEVAADCVRAVIENEVHQQLTGYAGKARRTLSIGPAHRAPPAKAVRIVPRQALLATFATHFPAALGHEIRTRCRGLYPPELTSIRIEVELETSQGGLGVELVDVDDTHLPATDSARTMWTCLGEVLQHYRLGGVSTPSKQRRTFDIPIARSTTPTPAAPPATRDCSDAKPWQPGAAETQIQLSKTRVTAGTDDLEITGGLHVTSRVWALPPNLASLKLALYHPGRGMRVPLEFEALPRCAGPGDVLRFRATITKARLMFAAPMSGTYSIQGPMSDANEKPTVTVGGAKFELVLPK